MRVGRSQHHGTVRRRARLVVPYAALSILATTVAGAQRAESVVGGSVPFFTPGNLVVSRSVYADKASAVSVGQTLPPGCFGAGCAHAIANGTYPFVFNNDQVDASFGITARILLDQITTDGTLVNTLEVPNNTMVGVGTNQMVTSFSSKSELALNLSTDGNFLSFMGYVGGVNAIDVSNSNTPKVFDATNLDHASYYRAVATVDAFSNFTFTVSNAYSGNNGRAALLNNTGGANVIYTAGNAGNGNDPQPTGIVLGAGAQLMTPSALGVYSQLPGQPTPLGSFNITQLSPTTKADKIGKDDNFRGLTTFDDVLYFSKGSGSNGVNTVYFLDTTGGQCSTNGQGLPSTTATLPTLPMAYDPTQLATKGLEPSNMCILLGFPAATAKSLTKKTTAYPFGVWFANATTAYVADEGDGSGDKLAGTGLEKWVLTGGSWKNVYTLQNGLGIGDTYSFPGDAAYPTGVNPVTLVDWAPKTAGLRNLTGRVNLDGTVTVWAITSTFSGSGDNGADPNMLVAITDVVANTTAAGAAGESFVMIRTAAYGEVLRGVSFAPGHSTPPANH